MARANRYRSKKHRGREPSQKGWGICVAGFVLGCGFIVVLSASLARGYFILTESEFFPLQSIEIKGVSQVNRRQVLMALGVSPGANMLGLRMQELAARIKRLAWVDRVALRLEPSGNLVVRIKEREPLAVLDDRGCFLLDSNGVLFKKIAPQEYSELPRVKGISRGSSNVGTKVAAEVFSPFRRLLAQVRQVKGLLPWRKTCRFEWEHDRGFMLRIPEWSITIILGETDFREKLARLRMIWHVIEKRHWQEKVISIDLDYSRRAYVKGTFPHSGGI